MNLNRRLSEAEGKVNGLEDILLNTQDQLRRATDIITGTRQAVGELTKCIKMQSDEIRAIQEINGNLTAQIADLHHREVAGEQVIGEHQLRFKDLTAKVGLLQARKEEDRDARRLHEKHLLKLVNLNREHGARRVESLI